jgi:hypothetical protein
MNHATDMELSQKQREQINSIHGYNECEYSDDEEEDPTPKWNIPNWKGNSKENKCNGCVTRIMTDGLERGCEECDQNWDLPELVKPICTGCITYVTYGGENRGCEECDEYWDMPDIMQCSIVNNETGDLPQVCTGCVTRVSPSGDARGCGECDENWDMPYLEYDTECEACDADCATCDAACQACEKCEAKACDVEACDAASDSSADDYEELKPYCEGCELLNSGRGGENQMGHACLGFF